MDASLLKALFQLLSMGICISCVAPNPDYIDPDSVPKRVFVTSAMLRGEYVSDELCQAAAEQGRLGGIWIGWYSLQTVIDIDALSRVRDVGPWVDLRGNLIFRNNDDIKGQPRAPINITENGYSLADDEPIWTGTQAGGVRGTNLCLDAIRKRVWGTNQPSVRGDIGLVGRVDDGWTYAGSQPCDQPAHLICIEQ